MFEITLSDYLREHTGLKALTSRIYAVKLPDNSEFPALRVVFINGTTDDDFSGITDDSRGNFQVDIWARNDSELIALVKAFKDAIKKINLLEQIEAVFDLREKPSYEPEENLFKRTFEFTINYMEQTP